MKKKIVIPAVIVAGFILFLPYLAGFITYARYLQVLDLLNTVNGLHFEKVSYERSWFGALATTNFTISDPRFMELVPGLKTNGTNSLTMTIKTKFYHGPLIYDKNVFDKSKHWMSAQTLAYSQFTIPDPANVDKKLEVERMRAVVNMNGSGTAIIESLPFSYTDPKTKTSLNWESINSKIDFAPNFTAVKTQVALPYFSVQSNGDKLIVDNVAIYSEQKRGVENLWLGVFNIKFSDLLVRDKQGGFSLSNLDFKIINGEDNKLITSRLDLTADSFVLNNERYGSPVLSTTVTRLDAKALNKWQEYLRKIDNTKDLRVKHFSTVEQMLRLLPGLLKQRPEVYLDFNAKTINGDILAKLEMAVGGERIVKDKNVSLLHALEDLALDAKVELPKKIVRDYIEEQARYQVIQKYKNDNLSDGEIILLTQKQTALDLKKLLDDKIFVEVGSQYIMKANVANEVLTVNGAVKEVPYL